MNNDKSTFGISINIEESNLQNSAAGFDLKTWGNIDQLNYNSSWIRYLNLNGHAVINYPPKKVRHPGI